MDVIDFSEWDIIDEDFRSDDQNSNLNFQNNLIDFFSTLILNNPISQKSRDWFNLSIGYYLCGRMSDIKKKSFQVFLSFINIEKLFSESGLKKKDV